MKRRGFLASGVTAGAATMWPSLLRDAFAARPQTDDPDKAAQAEVRYKTELAVISEGYRRAQQQGKPLLVLIIPADDTQKWERGRVLGAWLNHGTAEQVAPVLMAEVICASMRPLRTIAPSIGLGEPLMIVLETDKIPAVATELTAVLPSVEAVRMALHKKWQREKQRPEDTWAEQSKQEEAAVEQQIAEVSQLVRAALLRDEAMLSARVTQVQGKLAPTLAVRAQAGISSLAGLSDAEVDASAAVLLKAAPAGQRDKVYARLRTAIEAKLIKPKLPGAYWATNGGCATHVERPRPADDHYVSIVGCGMGHVPQKAVRFLYFFLPGERQF